MSREHSHINAAQQGLQEHAASGAPLMAVVGPLGVLLKKLPAAAYSAEVDTSATKAGSYGVFGEGE